MDVNTPPVAMVTVAMVTGVISQARVVTMVMPSNGADQQSAVVNGYLATTNHYFATTIFEFSYMYPTWAGCPKSALWFEHFFSQTNALLVSNQQRQSTECSRNKIASIVCNNVY